MLAQAVLRGACLEYAWRGGACRATSFKAYSCHLGCQANREWWVVVLGLVEQGWHSVIWPSVYSRAMPWC